jgi:hypothetical protein
MQMSLGFRNSHRMIYGELARNYAAPVEETWSKFNCCSATLPFKLRKDISGPNRI